MRVGQVLHLSLRIAALGVFLLLALDEKGGSEKGGEEDVGGAVVAGAVDECGHG